jgi:monothiol glutaredoxin
MVYDQSADVDPAEVPERVNRLLEAHERVLFIKGTPNRPQCGFSQRAVGTLSRYDVDFETVDVLPALPAYREALESHSGWETIPQLFVDGDFVGGSDIIVELEERGELAETLQV